VRIALTADEFYPAIGGSPTSAMELSTALAKLGAEPVVITHSYPGQPAEEEIDGVEVRRLDGFVIPKLNRAASVGLIYRLHRCIKYGGFDIVHGQDLYSLMSLTSVYSAKKCGIPSVVTCRSVHESSSLWRLIYQPIVFTLRRTNRVITVSGAAARFCQALGVPPHKTVVILNGIDLSKFDPSVDGSPLRRRLDLKDEPIVATAIRLVKRKGPGHLVASFAKVLRVVPNAKLVMAGWGPEVKNLQAQIQGLGLEKSVFMVGALSREKVAELMAAADVFVLPSAIEAFGRAAVEAAAVGTPVVCPRAGGMPEIIEDGSNGLMFRPGDEVGIADAILRVLKDRQLAERLRENGMKTARNLSLEATARRTLSLYEEVCEEHA
jgi:glycosyltransferase involved in cell wall biosynthesis